jgi:hypothetical protein
MPQSEPSSAPIHDMMQRMPLSVSFAPHFCPNGDIFVEMRFDQSGHIGGPATALCSRAKAGTSAESDGI